MAGNLGGRLRQIVILKWQDVPPFNRFHGIILIYQDWSCCWLWNPQIILLNITRESSEASTRPRIICVCVRDDLWVGWLSHIHFTLWLFNIAMENGPFIVDFPIKTSIYKGFSMAMLNNQMVHFKDYGSKFWLAGLFRSNISGWIFFFDLILILKMSLLKLPLIFINYSSWQWQSWKLFARDTYGTLGICQDLQIWPGFLSPWNSREKD